MESQKEARGIAAILRVDPGADCLRFCKVGFEDCCTPFLEPGDCLSSRRKPCPASFEILEQFAIELPPQPFGKKAAVVPIDGEATSELDRVVDHSMDDQPRFCRRES